MYFFQKNKYKIMLIAATTILVVCIIVGSSVSRRRASLASDAVGTVATPVQGGVTGVSDSISGFFNYLKNMKGYERENEKLRERIAGLEDDLRKTDNLREENERLRKMLDLKEKKKDYKTVAADVVAFEMDNFSKSYTINKGIKDGITQNCAVITPHGLVGYIAEVGRSWARICPIVDASVSVSATIVRVSNVAMVEGDMSLMDDGLCKMTYVSKDAGIEIGDYIETSGAGGVIPSGIYIGKVTEVRNDVTGVSQEAVIKPGVDFSDLDEVMVIIN
ncbi:MAG: rod shape-determining protein MreC [Clostridia bacterium]|nr:rod shape-determining protein MreC [Clostridia bacterium]